MTASRAWGPAVAAAAAALLIATYGQISSGAHPAPKRSASTSSALASRAALGLRNAGAIGGRKGVPLAERPNVVFISTDDQRVDDMRWMPSTRKLLGGHGVTFTRALSPHPLCCPARAEFVTGQYGQNNGVHHNEGVHGGYSALRDPGDTLARWLKAAGYQTGMAGKYLNGYRPDAPSRQGWDHWNPSVKGEYSYNRTTFFNDGHRVLHTENVDDAVTGYAQDYIREFSQRRAPFYVWASDLAPHVRCMVTCTLPVPAARHVGRFAGVRNDAERKPSYGVPIVGGPGRTQSYSPGERASQQRLFEARIESLQAVDEGVRGIVDTLRETGELANTYIIFTSDNGYLLGEHARTGKNEIYEEPLRVPMVVRVPDRARAATSSTAVTSVDIAATVADLTDVTPTRLLDGKSFLPILRGHQERWRDTQLIQTGYDSRRADDPGWLMRGVRTNRFTFARNQVTGQVELYDRAVDPYETRNVAGQPRYRGVVAALERRTRALVSCAGDTCRRSFGPAKGSRPTA